MAARHQLPSTHTSRHRLPALQLSDLTSDFTYNLGLLAERDAELERYDTSLVEMSSRLTLQVASISSLQGALAEAQAGEWWAGGLDDSLPYTHTLTTCWLLPQSW
jgi:hypothetical protein